MADIFNFYVYDDRSIRYELAEPIMLEDKDVTQFRFRIPKSLNGFDMSDWEWWFIFVNPIGTKYTSLLELTDDEDDSENYSIATYTVGYGFSGIVGTVRFSLEALYADGESIVNEWHTRTYSTTVTDTLQGHRAIIPEPEGQSSTGITEEVKQALLQIARKVAYIDEHGQTYYDALYNALYAVLSVKISPSSIVLNAIGNTRQLTATTVPEGSNVTWTSSDTSVATVSSDGLVTSVAWGNAIITATAGNKTASCSVSVAEVSVRNLTADYIQSGTVYDDATLDSLKSDLTVSVEYSDGTSAILADTDYALNGTLTVGRSLIEVSYGNMVTTFFVTVTKAVVLHSVTYNLTDCISSSDVTSVEDGKVYTTNLAVRSGYSISTATVMMGGEDVTSGVYSSGSIIINRVTGDIVITAVATKTVNSITATYTQSGTVYDTASLDDLKSDLVVTANYADGTSETVTGYTLSGTLTVGTSTVTVSYAGQTDTFTVTVASAPLVPTGYTQVEYAKLPTDAGSNIVINTELILTGTGEAVIDVDFMSESATTGYHHVIGCAQAATPSSIGIAVGISDTANTLVCYNGLTASIEPNGGSSLNGVRIQAVGRSSNGNASITDGTLSNAQTGTTRAYNQYPVSLFGIKKGTTAQTMNQFYGRIYRAKITENSTLLMDAVPCVRTNDNAVGFYDIVRDTFITHASLVAGDSV